ncbi:MAG: spore coat associated protein CotJA [Oscillospiraceae bacterium]|nr:spore coat associated protein CotJA [Oscillospiraceae bacterium]MBR6657433.1 spore coat associated protein CotJA [Oscillospiraceae bacterium]
MENNNNMNQPCVCGTEGGVLAMAKVPMQPWCQVYDGATAFSRGTIFPELDLPYLGRKATE